MCEKAKIKVVGRSVFVELESGAKAFIPLEKICEAAKRFNLCLERDSKVKCMNEQS